VNSTYVPPEAFEYDGSVFVLGFDTILLLQYIVALLFSVTFTSLVELLSKV
jgi:hypothetical protein